MRPTLDPALRQIWRATDTVQIGLDPERAIVLTGLSPGLRAVLDDLDGTGSVETVTARALARGVDSGAARRLLNLLAEGGVLADAAADPPPPGRGDAPQLDRQHSRVHVYGAGRVGASTASLLASAGVGRVSIVDPEPAGPDDLAPAGLHRRDLGTPRGRGAERAVRAVSGSAVTARDGDAPATTEGAVPERPTVALVLTDRAEVDRSLPDLLVRRDVPHLVARVRESVGLLGPFVIPGTTACLRCHDLYRADRDASWPHVLAQILAGRDRASCDVTLATLLAALATLHTLAYLDGQAPPSLNGTLEVRPPGGAPRRRSWTPHPRCGCQWDHLPQAPSLAPVTAGAATMDE